MTKERRELAQQSVRERGGDREFYFGCSRTLDGEGGAARATLAAEHLVTHGVVVGMTGSGKTGLLTVICEEALRARVPVLMIDVKGDLTNLLLTFPSFAPEHLVPWMGEDGAGGAERTERAAAIALARQTSLESWGIDEAALADFDRSIDVRVITPGSAAGEALHVLSSLERRSPRWDTDIDLARASLSAAISLVLRLVGRDADPARSREHVLLSVLAERRLRAGATAELTALLADLAEPPIERIGALELEEFFPATDRRALAVALNNLVAAPTFEAWREGATLDIAGWLEPKGARTPAVIVSVAHLDDEERTLVLGILLEEVLSWVRGLAGSERLRALVVFDEVYGFLPPHPSNPPTKRPLVALMKQARAFGVGVLVATQNPMDLDYRALSNAGLWCVGRLQTDADRERVVEGLGGEPRASAHGRRRKAHGGEGEGGLGATIRRLAPRWFVVRDAHARGGLVLLQPRYAMSYLRGPMTRSDLERALEARRERMEGGEHERESCEQDGGGGERATPPVAA